MNVIDEKSLLAVVSIDCLEGVDLFDDAAQVASH